MPINCFPGYEKIVEWKKTPEGPKKIVHNMYRGTDLGLGGYVYFEEGVYTNVALVDVSNMHGASIIALNKFAEHTQTFADIREANLAIKHKDFERLRTIMGGALAKYLDDPKTDWKALRTALKLVSNSTYGIADATFENPLRDSRDDNNIVALRGALFMRTLQDEVVNQGFKVAHIKTDSIKIPNANREIVDFCLEFAKKYDYEFEFEAVFEKLCLVNGSTYVGKYMKPEDCEKIYGFAPAENIEAAESGMMFTATAAQFQIPYVFKTLFSHEPIEFSDLCETKQASKGQLYLDFNEELPDVSDLEEAITKIQRSDNKLSVLADELKSNLKTRSEELIQKDINKELRSNERQMLYLQNRLGTTNSDKYELIEEARKVIAQGHRYQFIGGVGLFSPVVSGAGGGILLRRDSAGKYAAATGTKGYRWMESESVKNLGKENLIDKSYYTKLVDEAVKDISYWCDETNKKEGTNYNFEWFAS